MLLAFFDALDQQISNFASLFPPGTLFAHDFMLKGLAATLLVCLVCGAMGALVVGNRMAFFSDALAHCAFAGIGLGLVICLVLRIDVTVSHAPVTLFMVVFGVAVGLLIAFVRDKTELASDTVIGVFYAGAIGLGAVCTSLAAAQNRRNFNAESFIFGNPISVQVWEILFLLLLAGAIGVVLHRTYNAMILASASPSLAHSRRIPVRFYQYLLVVVLALLVNLSLQTVGALLINGLLIVPAAAAANLARNLRQMFWLSIGIAVAAGGGGFLLSWEISHAGLQVGISGAVVVLCVLMFVLSACLSALLRRSRSQPAQQAV
jgi:zinc transport system permease protein